MSAKSNTKWVRSSSYHARRGAIDNSFTYNVDYLLLPVHEPIRIKSAFLKHNKFGLFSFHDKDHGPITDGAQERTVSDIAQQIIDSENLGQVCDGNIWLYTQPRFLGFVFNPVSFWFFFDKQESLRVVFAEVNNRAGGRHFYICRHDDFAPIKSKDRILVKKIFHVSPFQDVKGNYTFRFLFKNNKIGGWIDYEANNKSLGARDLGARDLGARDLGARDLGARDLGARDLGARDLGDRGLYATLSGHVGDLQNRKLLKSALLRPFGAVRVVWLIYWQALKLKLKGAKFRAAPKQKDKRISR